VTFIGRSFGGYEPVKHLILPVLGALAIGCPLYELVKPGQPKPFSIYPLIVLGVLAIAIVWARSSTGAIPVWVSGSARSWLTTDHVRRVSQRH